MFGWRGKLLRVNLSNGALSSESPDPDVLRTRLGGHGLGVYLQTIGSNSDSADRLVFVTAPLTGTLAPNGGRYTVVAQNPFTAEIDAASISGKWGPALKYAGFDGIIFEGNASEPVYLYLKDGNAELRQAKHVWGKNVTDTTGALVKESDSRAVVSCIGPAGENKVQCSAIVSDLYSAAGQGLGAVMGAKNLKAVVVCGTSGFRVAERERFSKAAMELRSSIAEKSISACGSQSGGCYLTAESLSWEPVRPDVRPARSRGCFGCATSFSSFVYDGGQRSLSLDDGIPPAEITSRLQAYRTFTDFGLDFSAVGNLALESGVASEIACRLSAGEIEVMKREPAAGEKIQRGPCMFAGYAIAPRMTGSASELAILDSVGLCPFLISGLGMDRVAELMASATGTAFSEDEITEAGQRISREIRQTA